VASKVLRAQLVVDDYRVYGLTSAELERKIRSKLVREMESMLMDELDITSTGNPTAGHHTYTGTLTVGANGITGSTYGTGSVNHTIQAELRVVEYMKKGKVAKVELQQYTISGWKKVPRIQIEE
jgi:hypothetical protein